eukprot:8995954-Pyramimonas_sp.AAC.1
MNAADIGTMRVSKVTPDMSRHCWLSLGVCLSMSAKSFCSLSGISAAIFCESSFAPPSVRIFFRSSRCPCPPSPPVAAAPPLDAARTPGMMR